MIRARRRQALPFLFHIADIAAPARTFTPRTPMVGRIPGIAPPHRILLLLHRVGGAEMPLVPLALADLILLAAGLALLFSVANVYLRDMAHFVELALLAWFWVTPIVYPFTQLGRALHGHTIIALANPVT